MEDRMSKKRPMGLVGPQGEEIPKIKVREWDVPGVGKVRECVDCAAMIMSGESVRCMRCIRAIFKIKDCPCCRQLEVQLAGCAVAAQGWAKGEQKAEEGAYGWSPAYADVERIRRAMEVGREELQRRRATGNGLDIPLNEACDEIERLLKGGKP